ncbi:MAG TPA: FtsX-like permease family protein [Acidimicrobiales bacterium]|nr:FtsX-like permease family protein [Acidimicrobiales bacterium]
MVKIALRGLRAHTWRMVITFVAVAAGVAFIGGVLVLTDTMNRTFDDLFADVYRGTDAVVRSSETLDSDFGFELRGMVDESVLDQVRQADGLAAAEGSVDGFARVIDRDGEPVGNPATGAPTLGGTWVDVDELNPFDIVDGEAPRADGEIVLDRGTTESTDYELGDAVAVQTQVGVEEFELVGVARFGTADSPGGATYVLWGLDDAQRLMGEPGRFTSIGAVAEDGVSQDDLVASIAEQLDDGTTEVVSGAEITEETQSAIGEQLGFITIFFLVFALIAVFVGAFVIYNSFAIVVAQRTREMALLRAIGARRRQVRRAVVVEAAVVGLVGSAIGFVVGLGLAALLGAVLQLPEGALAILPSSVVVAIATGLIVTVISSLVPAWRASRVPPLAAMRDVAVDTSGRTPVRFLVGLGIVTLGVAAVLVGAFGSRPATVGIGVLAVFLGVLVASPGLARPVSRVLGAPLARLRGVTGTLARENAGRNPKRTSATAQALMIGVGLVTFMLVINTSIRASLDKALEEGFVGDFVVDSGTFGMIGLPSSVAEEIAELPEVAVSAPVRFAPAEVAGEEHGVTGTVEGAFEVLDLDMVDGRASLAPDEVVINEDVAEDTGLGVGDQVEIDFLDDARDERERTATVSGVYSTGPATDLGGYVVGVGVFQAALPTSTDFQVFVQLQDGVSVAEAEPALERIVDPLPSAEVQSVEEYKDEIGGQLDFLLRLIGGLLALAIGIAFLGIVNTISLSIIERTRELGLLRAVGMRRRQLRAAIRWESAIISLFGTLLGVAVGLLGGWGIVRALRDEGFEVFAVPLLWLVVISVIAGLLGLAAALIPAWRAGRMSVLEAIATE